MPIRLIALDIDATLTSRPTEVSERNRNAIQAAADRGVQVIVATGRGCFATRPIWKLLDLHGPSIQYGGALTVEIDTERVIEQHTLDPKVVQEILIFAAEAGIPAQVYQNDVVIFERMTPAAERYVMRHTLPYQIVPDIRERLFENVPKVLAFSEIERQDEMLERFRARFRGEAEVSRSMPGYIEINCLHVTKGSALESLAGRLGIDRSEVAAVGDNYLDSEMIEWAGVGVCVANGADSVKEQADIVVPACDEDGVAYFIERYVLPQGRLS